MADHIYDLIIIGAGPAGYTAALRAAAMGMDAVLIEKKALGGSCVNTGCIPAKALLQATAVYRDMLKAFRFGIVAEKVSFDWRQMQIYKNESVESFRSMIQGMLEKAEVEMIHGDARLHADNVVRVTTSKGALTLKGKNVILATGSSPVIPDIPGIDLPQVMTSRDILRMDDWNFDCLTVIGGGVIGVEIATIFAALGSRVTLLEQANRLLESMDPMISEQMEANLRSKGIEVHCNVQVMEIKDRGNDTVSVNYRCERGWKESPADRVLWQSADARICRRFWRTIVRYSWKMGVRSSREPTARRRKMSMRSAIPWRGNVLPMWQRPMRLIWSKTWRDADTGCSFRSCRTVCMSCFRLCRPVFIRSRRLRRLDLRKMTPAFII